MNQDKANSLARAAGASGLAYDKWLDSDEAQDLGRDVYPENSMTTTMPVRSENDAVCDDALRESPTTAPDALPPLTSSEVFLGIVLTAWDAWRTKPGATTDAAGTLDEALCHVEIDGQSALGEGELSPAGKALVERVTALLCAPPPVDPRDRLALAVMVAPFRGGAHAVVDRRGPWTMPMIHDFPTMGSDFPGLWVWEGDAAEEPGDGWGFTGAWRGPTSEEMSRLARGRFPLRGHAFPALSSPQREKFADQ